MVALTSASLLVLLAAAPAIYTILGAPLVLAGQRRTTTDLLAPLFGCTLAGWLGEIALIVGVSWRWLLCAAFATSTAALVLRRSEVGRFLRCLRDLYVAYLPAAAIVALSSSPAATGIWGGDWAEQFAMGRAVFLGDYSGAPIHREPLFGAAAAPLQLVLPALPSLMAFSAVAAAAAALAVIYGIEVWGKTRVTCAALAPFMTTPFFLLHVPTVWAKQLAAGAAVVAVVDSAKYLETRRFRSWLSSCLWIGAAVAIHKSSVIYLGMIASLYPLERSAYRTAVRDAAVLACALALIAVPFDAWIISQRGMSERVAANPVIYFSEKATPIKLFSIKVRNLISSVTGMPQAVRKLPTTIEKVSFLVVWQAGTLLGTFWPFVPRAVASAGLGTLFRTSLVSRRVAAGGITVLLLNAILNPYPGPHGLTQTGLVAFCLMIFVWLFAGPRPRALELVAVLVCGTVPLLLVNSINLYDLATRTTPFEPGTFRYMLRLGGTSFGYELWPFSLALGWGLMIAYLWLALPHVRADAPPQHDATSVEPQPP
jgi:hypothetical protein